jgi:hypothetical protein
MLLQAGRDLLVGGLKRCRQYEWCDLDVGRGANKTLDVHLEATGDVWVFEGTRVSVEEGVVPRSGHRKSWKGCRSYGRRQA